MPAQLQSKKSPVGLVPSTRLCRDSSVTQGINWALSLTLQLFYLARDDHIAADTAVSPVFLPCSWCFPASGTKLSYKRVEPAWHFKVLPEISKQPHVSGASARRDQQLPGGRGSRRILLGHFSLGTSDRRDSVPLSKLH